MLVTWGQATQCCTGQVAGQEVLGNLILRFDGEGPGQLLHRDQAQIRPFPQARQIAVDGVVRIRLGDELE